MKIEDLEKTLKSSPIIENYKRFAYGHEQFERLFEFSIRNNEYKIEWYNNLCTIYINEFEMMFDHVYVESTWPEHYKNFLQFYNEYNKIIAVIPLEKYED